MGRTSRVHMFSAEPEAKHSLLDTRSLIPGSQLVQGHQQYVCMMQDECKHRRLAMPTL